MCMLFAEGFHIEIRFVAVCPDEQDGGGEAVILPVGIQGGRNPESCPHKRPKSAIRSPQASPLL